MSSITNLTSVPTPPYDIITHKTFSGILEATTHNDVVDLRYLEARYNLTVLVVQKILTPIVVLFGLIGNTINIAILTRPWMLTSTNWYLTSLAVYDILYLVFAFTLSLKHYQQVGTSRGFLLYQTYIGESLTNIWSNTGIWITVTFTVERYIVVCHPLRGKVLCTRGRAKQIVACVCVFAAIITFPEFFTRTVRDVQIDNSTDNATVPTVVPTAFGNSTYFRVVYQYLNQALFTFLPLLMLGVFNTLLIRTLIKAARRRAHMTNSTSSSDSNQAKDQQRVTMMLIAVVIVFLCCQLPSALTVLYKYADRRKNPKTRLDLKIAGNFLNLLVMLNSSVNFVLYSSFSTKFRQTFSQWFCCCLDAKGKPSDKGSNPGRAREGNNVRKSATALTPLSGTAPSAMGRSVSGGSENLLNKGKEKERDASDPLLKS